MSRHRAELGRRRLATGAAVVAVAVIAVAFRLWRYDTVPPGLFIDEVLTARNALAWRLAAQRDWLGAMPLLDAGWVETSHLYLAYASAVMCAFGDGLLAVRMISVLPSLLCVPLLYALGRQLAGHRAGLLAALLLACSHWAARTGRTGWDQVLMTALQLAALLLLARAANRRGAAEGAGAGALLGLAQHTYVASRLALAHAVLWQGWEALARWRRGVREEPAGRRLLLLVLVATLVAAPFHLRLLRERPEQLGLRARQLSALAVSGPGEPWATLAASARDHLLMFHWRGGSYARDALPGFPMLDPVTGALLLVGLAVVARRPGWPRRLLVTWPAVGLLAGVLSVSGEGAPYPYRVANLAPWACLVAALGGDWLWQRLRAHQPRSAPPLAAGTLVLALLVNAWVLFVAGPAYPGAQRVYGVAPTTTGRWLAAHRQGRPTIVHLDALRIPPAGSGYRYAAANRTDFFGPVEAAAAVHLAAGVYRERPRRALAPLSASGDVDVVGELPASWPRDVVVVVPQRLADEALARLPGAERHLLRLPDGRPFAVALVPVAR